ncbi:Alpha/Beta hydrolase protein [Gymnopilus junonius]|uniref:Carboxylic ester hydrolase n=1 Tax=Gymnopilus junonius TaxID=109634 RepID=A0A9P5TU96_GYMJU|nr:Alpha/Beta hydrolase protein [Gymnopilus junonius]
MVLYVPSNLDSTSNASTLMWYVFTLFLASTGQSEYFSRVHGGSFIVGSATGAGLNGSNLAIATNSIVAVVQYRLGALGFLPPNGQTNLAVKDLMNALQFLGKVVPAFGGSASKITIAGQSSGASMIRALLAVPSATSLFRSAILQSDPMDFGFLRSTTQKTLQAYFNGGVGCGSTNTACAKSLSVDDILDNQMDVFNNAINLDPAAGNSEPIRPVLDGSFITAPLDSTAPFPPVNKPILVTTVAQDAGFAIYLNSPDPVPEDEFAPALNLTFGPARTATILNSGFYTPVPSDGSVDARVQLQTLGTDYLWRCSSWTFARNWAQHGGSVYVGQFVVGATYPGNEVVPYCTQPGIVCHQDDIEIVFGTVPSPSSAQSALVAEMQARYKAFLSAGNPNTPGFATWTLATNSDVHALVLGGSGEVSVGACTPAFWGSGVQYDYQFFDE